ncbi:hypothetical protein, partial [Elstera litoralis]|uniref:hypothetical protein n=1 Tax=Elstera litoralis TaxID=552518 RepID=UPI001E39F810
VVEAMGMDFYTSSQNSGYAFTVPPNDFALSYLVDNKGISTSIMSLIVHFTQYYVHSGYEYLYIFDRLPSEHTWGAYNFFHIYKFFALILGDPNINNFINNLDIRAGVYATFFCSAIYRFWLGWSRIHDCFWICVITSLACDVSAPGGLVSFNGLYVDHAVSHAGRQLYFFSPGALPNYIALYHGGPDSSTGPDRPQDYCTAS